MTGRKRTLRILALEPYYGGSHKDFLDQWSSRSRHQWTLLTLPPFKWRWRMRHSALYFAEQLSQEDEYDLIVCSDMLNLSEFMTFCPEHLRSIPSLAYFHENQLTYPLPEGHRRDYHTAYMNFTTALRSTQSWFNSDFHRQEFYTQLKHWMKRMPDFPPVEGVKRAEEKSQVMYPAVELHHNKAPSRTETIHLLWAARFDYDKNVEAFRDALRLLLGHHEMKVNISIIGEQFHEEPPIFAEIKEEFASHIHHWGYQESRESYEKVLASADLVISTALHEFFGMAVMEAVASGCTPLLPKRLAYPELFDAEANPDFFYNGTPEHLAQRIRNYILHPDRRPDGTVATNLARKHLWEHRIHAYDDRLETLFP